MLERLGDFMAKANNSKNKKNNNGKKGEYIWICESIK